MPSLIEAVTNQLSGPALEQITQSIGADSQTTSAAIQAALPMLISALAQNAGQPGGAEALAGALERDHDGGIFNDLSGFLGGSAPSIGAGILGHIFGQRTEQVGSVLGAQTGLDSGRMLQLLQMLAPLVMGALGRTHREGGLDAGGLAGLLGGERQQVEQSLPSMAGILGSILDSNRDGSAMDDVARLGGELLGGFFKKDS